MQKVNMELGGSSRTYRIATLLFLKSEHICLKLRILLPVYIDVADFTCMWRITLHVTKDHQKRNKKATL